MPIEHIETLVIGGGQAGLTVSHMLSQAGCRHLVLERARIAERWRTERWDGLRFQFPNWSVKLPNFPFRHADPDGFCTSAEIVAYLTAYAEFIAAPVRGGRRVYLSVGHHRRMPRRYRGRDLIWWISALGLDQTPVEKRGPDKALPLITGAYGGHTIDFRKFSAQGIILLGRLVAAENGIVEVAPDLEASLAAGDRSYAGFLELVDGHVAQHKLDVPEDPDARAVRPDPPDVLKPLRRLDLREAGISAVIWSTGYGCDFSWIDLPVFDARGEPVHRDGVTDVPGLYFIGLQWLSRMNSSFLAGIGQDADRLAQHIAARR